MKRLVVVVLFYAGFSPNRLECSAALRAFGNAISQTTTAGISFTKNQPYPLLLILGTIVLTTWDSNVQKKSNELYTDFNKLFGTMQEWIKQTSGTLLFNGMATGLVLATIKYGFPKLSTVLPKLSTVLPK